MKHIRDVVMDCLIGEAVGDAFGCPVEFMTRQDVRLCGLKDMEGCDTNPGKYGRWSSIIPAGAWTDDTSLTVAAMVSIAEKNGVIDHEDIMIHFLDWWEHGLYCSVEKPFGLGRTTSRAFDNYYMGSPAIYSGGKDVMDNGNGSLMRILPFALYAIYKAQNMEQFIEIINTGSAITHGHEISKMGCLIYAIFLRNILAGFTKGKAWDMTRRIRYNLYYGKQTVKEYSILLSGDFGQENINETGYVVDTLMTAVYSILHSMDFESAVITAVNMGFDTDTAGAVTGGLAGALYGRGSIPRRWRAKLLRGDFLGLVALNFADALS